MTFNPTPRKVLIIEDEPAIRNVLYVLLAGLGCDGDVAHDSQHALSMIRQDSFDAVLLDLRSAPLGPEQMVTAITELRPSLVGRVLVITGEVSDPNTLAMIERYAAPDAPCSQVTSDLWGRLRTVLGFTPSSVDSRPHSAAAKGIHGRRPNKDDRDVLGRIRPIG